MGVETVINILGLAVAAIAALVGILGRGDNHDKRGKLTRKAKILASLFVLGLLASVWEKWETALAEQEREHHAEERHKNLAQDLDSSSMRALDSIGRIQKNMSLLQNDLTTAQERLTNIISAADQLESMHSRSLELQSQFRGEIRRATKPIGELTIKLDFEYDYAYCPVDIAKLMELSGQALSDTERLYPIFQSSHNDKHGRVQLDRVWLYPGVARKYGLRCFSSYPAATVSIQERGSKVLYRARGLPPDEVLCLVLPQEQAFVVSGDHDVRWAEYDPEFGSLDDLIGCELVVSTNGKSERMESVFITAGTEKRFRIFLRERDFNTRMEAGNRIHTAFIRPEHISTIK